MGDNGCSSLGTEMEQEKMNINYPQLCQATRQKLDYDVSNRQEDCGSEERVR